MNTSEQPEKLISVPDVPVTPGGGSGGGSGGGGGGSGSGGSSCNAASIILCYYGDDPATTLFQETLKLKKAMEGYTFKVLLKHETLPSWADLSEADEKLADIKALPTKANLFKYILEMTDMGLPTDVYLFTHGYDGQLKVSNGVYGSDERLTAADITRELGMTKTGRPMHIRTAVGWSCFLSSLGATWRSVGAKVTAGARHVQFYPNGAGNFLDDWNKGNVSFEDAVRGSDTDLVRTASQTYIRFVDAPQQEKQGVWDGCPGLNSVLGDHPCAKDYFDERWGLDSEWQADLSGKDNMNHSSFMVIGGDRSITKNTKPTW